MAPGRSPIWPKASITGRGPSVALSSTARTALVPMSRPIRCAIQRSSPLGRLTTESAQASLGAVETDGGRLETALARRSTGDILTPHAPLPVAPRAGVDGTVDVSMQQLNDRPVVLARSCSDRRRGALARRDGETLAAAARIALQHRVPLVLELASSGADVSEGIDSLHGWGQAAAATSACSGIVPVIAAVRGPVVSGPALLLALADVVVMSQDAV